MCTKYNIFDLFAGVASACVALSLCASTETQKVGSDIESVLEKAAEAIAKFRPAIILPLGLAPHLEAGGLYHCEPRGHECACSAGSMTKASSEISPMFPRISKISYFYYLTFISRILPHNSSCLKIYGAAGAQQLKHGS